METLTIGVNKVQKLVGDLYKANQAAKAFSEIEDGGSCNFDSAVIKLDKWKEKDIKDVCELSGIDIGDPLSSSYFKGYRFVNIGQGQGNRRTKMAEAAKKSLQEDGYDVRMYYQMD